MKVQGTLRQQVWPVWERPGGRLLEVRLCLFAGFFGASLMQWESPISSFISSNMKSSWGRICTGREGTELSQQDYQDIGWQCSRNLIANLGNFLLNLDAKMSTSGGPPPFLTWLKKSNYQGQFPLVQAVRTEDPPSDCPLPNCRQQRLLDCAFLSRG